MDKLTMPHVQFQVSFSQFTAYVSHIHTHLALHICCQQYVPCSKVSVDETLLGEVLHSISYLPTELQ